MNRKVRFVLEQRYMKYLDNQDAAVILAGGPSEEHVFFLLYSIVFRTKCYIKSLRNVLKSLAFLPLLA
jgi:hypothetical protein